MKKVDTMGVTGLVCSECGCPEMTVLNRIPVCVDCETAFIDYRVLKINGEDHELSTEVIKTFQSQRVPRVLASDESGSDPEAG